MDKKDETQLPVPAPAVAGGSSDSSDQTRRNGPISPDYPQLTSGALADRFRAMEVELLAKVKEIGAALAEASAVVTKLSSSEKPKTDEELKNIKKLQVMINDLKSSEKNIFHSLSLLSTAINSGDINGLMSSIGLTPDSAVELDCSAGVSSTSPISSEANEPEGATANMVAETTNTREVRPLPVTEAVNQNVERNTLNNILGPSPLVRSTYSDPFGPSDRKGLERQNVNNIYNDDEESLSSDSEGEAEAEHYPTPTRIAGSFRYEDQQFKRLGEETLMRCKSILREQGRSPYRYANHDAYDATNVTDSLNTAINKLHYNGEQSRTNKALPSERDRTGKNATASLRNFSGQNSDLRASRQSQMPSELELTELFKKLKLVQGTDRNRHPHSDTERHHFPDDDAESYNQSIGSLPRLNDHFRVNHDADAPTGHVNFNNHQSFRAANGSQVRGVKKSNTDVFGAEHRFYKNRPIPSAGFSNPGSSSHSDGSYLFNNEGFNHETGSTGGYNIQPMESNSDSRKSDNNEVTRVLWNVLSDLREQVGRLCLEESQRSGRNHFLKVHVCKLMDKTELHDTENRTMKHELSALERRVTSLENIMTEFQIKQEDADRRLLQEFVSENYANRNNNNDILYENLDTLRTRASNFQNFQNLNNRVVGGPPIGLTPMLGNTSIIPVLVPAPGMPTTAMSTQTAGYYQQAAFPGSSIVRPQTAAALNPAISSLDNGTMANRFSAGVYNNGVHNQNSGHISNQSISSYDNAMANRFSAGLLNNGVQSQNLDYLSNPALSSNSRPTKFSAGASNNSVQNQNSGSFVNSDFCRTPINGNGRTNDILNNSSQSSLNNLALNNQGPPGTRANNYWDNFRSYSRQNMLSSPKLNGLTNSSASSCHVEARRGQSSDFESSTLAPLNNVTRPIVVNRNPVGNTLKSLGRTDSGSFVENISCLKKRNKDQKLLPCKSNSANSIQIQTERNDPLNIPGPSSAAPFVESSDSPRNSANNLTEINKELEQEVTRFLRRNNENPCYIMELFQKLSMMETDYARHRALTALQNVLSDVLPSEMLLGAVGCESNPNNNSRNQFTSTRNITDLSSLNSSESQFNRQPQAIVPPYQENELAERSDNEGVSQDTEIARAPRDSNFEQQGESTYDDDHAPSNLIQGNDARSRTENLDVSNEQEYHHSDEDDEIYDILSCTTGERESARSDNTEVNTSIDADTIGGGAGDGPTQEDEHRDNDS